MDALCGSASPEIADTIKREYHGNDHFSYLTRFLYSFPEYLLRWIPDTERNGIFGLSNSILRNAILLFHCT